MVYTKGRYALRLMAYMAKCARDEYITLDEISKSEDISEKYLELITIELVKRGLLTGKRGRGGGYKLNKDPKEITVGEILYATEGELRAVSCLEKGDKCERADECMTLPLWKELDRITHDYLDSITLDELIRGEVKSKS